MLACPAPSILLQEDSTTSVTLAGTIYFRSIVAKVETMDNASMCYVYVNVQPVCASSLQMLSCCNGTRYLLSLSLDWSQKRWSGLPCSEQLQQPGGRGQRPHFLQRQLHQVDG